MESSYNPESLQLSPAFDSWLREGGIIVTASDRAARSLRFAYNQQRSAEGMYAWPAPSILDWASLLLKAWTQYAPDDRLVLNRAQEEILWAGILAHKSNLTALLPDARHRMAQLAMQGYAGLCAYSPLHLDPAARKHWTLDQAEFSQWIQEFEATCRTGGFLSLSRLPVEMLAPLKADLSPRAPLLAVGFDRLQPAQESFFQAWGAWKLAEPDESAPAIHYWSASDPLQELEGCASWCSHFLRDNPSARILVISQEVALRRGEMERAFLDSMPTLKAPAYEFTLGIPLDEAPAPKAHLLMLRWLRDPLTESEVDWLFAGGISAQNHDETLALQASMRSLRCAGQQRPEWNLTTLIREADRQTPLPASWVQRMTMAQRRLAELLSASKRPSEWSEWAVALIRDMRPQGNRDLSSAAFQSMRRWEDVLDTCSSLGFSGSKAPWHEFVAVMARAMQQTLFSPESEDAPVLITGPSESAGLKADAIWFLGADEDSWPMPGAAHPLLPMQLQRETGMPHADPLQEWTLAERITARLVASAPLVQFSYARRKEAVEQRPSGIVSRLAPVQTMLGTRTVGWLQPQTSVFVDATRIPFTAHSTAGGASILTDQSQCPFKAVAVSRLGAQKWDTAQPCLTPAQRGQLLHAVLGVIWSGPPDGLSTLSDLQHRLADLPGFVETHVQRLVPAKLHANVAEWMPARYLELERIRLTRLLTEWLRYEATRLPFTVAGVEVPQAVSIAGLSLHLRMDRVDRLNEGSALVIDYKTGNVSPSDWKMPRPADVQLPLYAVFAIRDPKPVGGLAFAKIRAGESGYAGFIADPSETLLAGLKPSHPLVKNPLTHTMLEEWRHSIEQLAADYLQGRADVDPRDGAKTCAACGLHTLCRVHEVLELIEEESGEEEAAPNA